MESKKLFDEYYDWLLDKTDITLENMERIIFGFENSTPDFLPNKIDVFLKNLHITSILDYGAGLGRNLPMLQKYSCDIVDYIDLANYENKFSEYIDSLSYNNKFYINGVLPDLLDKKYDLIYASVVLQHIIDDETFEKIIKILAEKSKYLVIVQNCEVPIKKIMNLYYDFICEETESTTFKGVKHSFIIYKSKL
jgi:SAM-dependent methyltransferase